MLHAESKPTAATPKPFLDHRVHQLDAAKKHGRSPRFYEGPQLLPSATEKDWAAFRRIYNYAWATVVFTAPLTKELGAIMAASNFDGTGISACDWHWANMRKYLQPTLVPLLLRPNPPTAYQLWLVGGSTDASLGVYFKIAFAIVAGVPDIGYSGKICRGRSPQRLWLRRPQETAPGRF